MPDTYADIKQAIEAAIRGKKSTSAAVARFSQAEAAKTQNLAIDEGICQGLVIEWLACKKQKKPFAIDKQVTAPKTAWVPYDTSLGRSKDAQRATEMGISSQDAIQLPAATLIALSDRGFDGTTERLSVWTRNTGAGKKAWGAAADRIEDAEYNFFNLVIGGDDNNANDPQQRRYGHAIGVHRPHQTFGKSKSYSVFDPNIGEFLVDELTADTVFEMILAIYEQDGLTVDVCILDGIK